MTGTNLRYTNRPIVTIVTPVFNEEENLGRYVDRVSKALLANIEFEFRVFFIDDGSRDQSWQMIEKICESDARFQGLRLSRNFGTHAALSAGLIRATGDAAVVLACDLQDPPEVVVEFARKWREGFDLVFGKRRTRQDGHLRVLASNILYGLLARFALPGESKFTTGSFLLASRNVLDCYHQFQEHNRITFALMAWTGFEQTTVEYDRASRKAGKSGWSFGQMMKSSYDAFIGFSYLPVRMITITGLVVFAMSFGIAVYAVYCKMHRSPLPGWASLMAVFGFFFGVQFFLMSLIGEYLYRMYIEIVKRPLFLIAEECGGGDRAIREASGIKRKVQPRRKNSLFGVKDDGIASDF